MKILYSPHQASLRSSTFATFSFRLGKKLVPSLRKIITTLVNTKCSSVELLVVTRCSAYFKQAVATRDPLLFYTAPWYNTYKCHPFNYFYFFHFSHFFIPPSVPHDSRPFSMRVTAIPHPRPPRRPRMDPRLAGALLRLAPPRIRMARRLLAVTATRTPAEKRRRRPPAHRRPLRRAVSGSEGGGAPARAIHCAVSPARQRGAQLS